MAKTVNVTLTAKGADTGNFTVSAYNGNTFLSTIATNQNLVVGTTVQYTNVDDAATYIRVASTGNCTNYVAMQIQTT